MGIHFVLDDIAMELHGQGVGRGQGCGMWDCVVNVVGVECGGGEVLVDKCSTIDINAKKKVLCRRENELLPQKSMTYKPSS